MNPNRPGSQRSWSLAFFIILLVAVPTREAAAQQAMIDEIQKSVESAIATAQVSVVAISRVRKGSVGDPTDPAFIPNDFGLGVVVSVDGLILTNNHVLGDPEQNDHYVWLSKTKTDRPSVVHSASIIATDPWSDLAVIKIDQNGLSPINFGNGDSLNKGQFVISLGDPFAIAKEGSPNAAWGIVSNLHQRPPRTGSKNATVDPARTTRYEYGTLIQTDAKLRFQVSGGALISLDGKLVGLTSSLAGLGSYQSDAGYSIPVDKTFKHVVESLKQGKLPEYGFLSIRPGDLSDDLKRAGKTGVQVTEVVPGTPAFRSGIRLGDIITHVGSARVTSPDELFREVERWRVDQKVNVHLLRGAFGSKPGEKLRLEVPLSKKFVASHRDAIHQVPLPEWNGLTVDYSTAVPDFETRSAFFDPDGCVAITAVNPDSVAWKAGARPYLFISHVNGQHVDSPDKFHSIVNRASGIVKLSITTIDPNKRNEIAVESN